MTIIKRDSPLYLILQATLAAYGAVANNANRMVHLTTINEMAHHRSNVHASNWHMHSWHMHSSELHMPIFIVRPLGCRDI